MKLVLSNKSKPDYALVLDRLLFADLNGLIILTFYILIDQVYIAHKRTAINRRVSFPLSW